MFWDKFSIFTLFLAAIGGTAGCSLPAEGGDAPGAAIVYGAPERIGKLQNPKIKESSGLAASLCQENVFWTHNDSEDGPLIFAMDRAGNHIGTWTVTGAENEDWEDMAARKDASGKCYLYLGEIGNNERERPTFTVYKVAEPRIPAKPAAETEMFTTETAQMLRFRYPQKSYNAETLLVHPVTEAIYVLTKRLDGPSRIFKIEPQFPMMDPKTAKEIGQIAVPSVPNGLLTGGSISPDGTRLVLCDYSSGYEVLLPPGETDFDKIFEQRPQPYEIGEHKQGEAVTYTADGSSIVSTSEKRGTAIYEIKRVK